MKRTVRLQKLLAQASKELGEMYELERARTERRQKRMEQKLNLLKDLLTKGTKQ